MWNRKAFSVVPPGVAIMVALLGLVVGNGWAQVDPRPVVSIPAGSNTVVFTENISNYSITNFVTVAPTGSVTDPGAISQLQVRIVNPLDDLQKNDDDQPDPQLGTEYLFIAGSSGTGTSGTISYSNTAPAPPTILTFFYDENTATMNISGAGTAANYSDAIKRIRYSNSSQDPTGDNPTTSNTVENLRTLTYQAFDATGGGAIDQSFVAVRKSNNFPGANAGSDKTTAQPGPGQQVQLSASVGDIDDEGKPMQVQLSVTNGTLDVNRETGLTRVAGANGSATVTYTGSQDDINNALNTGLGGGITFNPDATFTNEARFTININDLRNTGFNQIPGSGLGLEDTDSATIRTQNPVGGAPVIDLNGGDTGVDYQTNFTKGPGGGGQVRAVDTDAVITDIDQDIRTITAQIQGGDDGTVESLNADSLNIPGISVSYSSTNRTLTITRSGTATQGDLQNVLRTVVYLNSSTPSGTERDILFIATDSTAGGPRSASATTKINFVTATGPSTTRIDLSGGAADSSTDYSTTWNQGGSTNLTAPSAYIEETDNVISKVTVTIDNPSDGLSEKLAAATTPGITASYNPGNYTLTLQGPASEAAYITAIRGVTYTNSPGTPTGTTRNFTFRAYGNDDTTVTASAVTMISVNGPTDPTDPTDPGGGGGGNGVATIDLNGADEAGVDFVGTLKAKTATPLSDTDAIVSKNPSSDLTKITITIQNRLDDLSERLSAPNANNGTTTPPTNNPNVVASYDAGEGVLTLTGPASPAEFQFAIRSVTYINNKATVTGTSRNIQFRVFGGSQIATANAILTLNGNNPGNNVDTDGDGIPDSQTPDDDGNGIPDDQDNNSPSGGTGGDSNGSFGGVTSRIDLNGSGSGYNYTTGWDAGGSTKLASDDSTIKGNDMIQKLVVSVSGGSPGGGTLTATAAGGITVSGGSGSLTLQGPASRQAFETTLHSIRYNGNPPSGASQAKTTFRFDLYGDVNNAGNLTSSATTTLDANADPNANNEIFNGSSTVTGDTATIVFRVKNTTGQTINGITIKGKLSGGRPYAEEADFDASVGTVSAKFVTPDLVRRYLQPDKYGGKNVTWRIDTLAAGAEATLTITVPLLKESMGNKLTEDFTASFPAGITGETVSAMQAQ